MAADGTVPDKVALEFTEIPRHIVKTWLEEVRGWFGDAAISAVMLYEGLSGYGSIGSPPQLHAQQNAATALLSVFFPQSSKERKQRELEATVTPEEFIEAVGCLGEALRGCGLDDAPVLSRVIESAAADCLDFCLGVGGGGSFARPRSYCTWKRGVQVQYNVTRIGDALLAKNIFFLDAFSPVLQAAKLLQLAKTLQDSRDLPLVAEACPSLAICQIRRILEAYTPDDLEVGPVAESFLEALETWRADLDLAADILCSSRIATPNNGDDAAGNGGQERRGSPFLIAPDQKRKLSSRLEHPRSMWDYDQILAELLSNNTTIHSTPNTIDDALLAHLEPLSWKFAVLVRLTRK